MIFLYLSWSHLTSLDLTGSHWISLDLTWSTLIPCSLNCSHLISNNLTLISLNSLVLTWTHLHLFSNKDWDVAYSLNSETMTSPFLSKLDWGFSNPVSFFRRRPRILAWFSNHETYTESSDLWSQTSRMRQPKSQSHSQSQNLKSCSLWIDLTMISIEHSWAH